jgi:hypothetical protein
MPAIFGNEPNISALLGNEPNISALLGNTTDVDVAGGTMRHGNESFF